MAIEIKWTKRAETNFDKIVNYIESEWGHKSAQKFVRKVYNLLNTLKKQPQIGKVQIKEKGIRGFVFSRQNTVFYRISGNRITLLAIFDNRREFKNI